MGRRTIHYHDHLVGIARHRLGRIRAEVLLNDAARGAEAHRDALARAMDAEVREYSRGDDRLLAVLMRGDGPRWEGADFEIDQRFPDIMHALMIGRRMGDVVEGTGADDHLIEAIGPGRTGDRLRIATTLVAGREIVPPMMHRLVGPVRRAWRICTHQWRETSNMETTSSTLSDIAMGIAGMMTQCLMVAAIMLGSLMYDRVTQVITVTVIMPIYGWFGSMMAAMTWNDIKVLVRRRRQRRAGA